MKTTVHTAPHSQYAQPRCCSRCQHRTSACHTMSSSSPAPSWRWRLGAFLICLCAGLWARMRPGGWVFWAVSESELRRLWRGLDGGGRRRCCRFMILLQIGWLRAFFSLFAFFLFFPCIGCECFGGACILSYRQWESSGIGHGH